MERTDTFATNPVVIAVAVGLVTILVILALRNSGTPEKEPATRPAKAFADVSKGLQKELQGSVESNADGGSSDKVLSASVFRSFPVLKVTQVSPNTKSIRFELPAGKSLGLAIGRHITLRAEIDGQKVMRAYTPTSRIDQEGFFELLIKSYEFGKMSSYLHSLRPGQSVDVRGPVGRFQYQINHHTHIGLIAGGTGLTPCLQLVRTILQCPSFQEDRTRLTLFFQNRCEEDILLFDTLEELRRKHKDRLKVVYFLSNASTDSFGRKPDAEVRGYIHSSHVSQFMNRNNTSLVCLCGPSGFNSSMKTLLMQAGSHDESSIFVW